MNQFELSFPKTLEWLGAEDFALLIKFFEAEIHGQDEDDLMEMSHLFPGFVRQHGESKDNSKWKKASWIADWEWTREFVEELRNEMISTPVQLHVISSGESDQTTWRLNSTLQPVLLPEEDVRVFLKSPSLILFFINRAGDFCEVAGDEVTAEILEAFNEQEAWTEKQLCRFVGEIFALDILTTELRRLEREGILVVSSLKITSP